MNTVLSLIPLRPFQLIKHWSGTILLKMRFIQPVEDYNKNQKHRDYVKRKGCWFYVEFSRTYFCGLRFSGTKCTKHHEMLPLVWSLPRHLMQLLWWSRTSRAERQRSRGVLQTSWDTWRCFLQPVPLIVLWPLNSVLEVKGNDIWSFKNNNFDL